MTLSLKVGTFTIHGNMRKGYWIQDTDTFNNWGTKRQPNNENWKTRQEAGDYALRCHEFKTGRRISF